MLRAGFIGFGRMGICHFAVLNPHPGVKVVGISDPSVVMRGILKNYVDKELQLFGDYRDMLEKQDLDVIVISTPPSTHAEIIKAAVDKGIHIFVEKPFCLEADDGESILQSLEGRKLITQVGYVNRFCETFATAKGIIDSGELGKLIAYSSEMYSSTVIKEASAGWRSKKNEGGGCLYEMASHAIDLSAFLFGMPDSVSGSVLNKIYSQNVDDQVLSTFKHDDGVVGSLSVNWSDPAYRKPSNELSGLFENGKIVVNKYGLRIFAKKDIEVLKLKAGWNTNYLAEMSDNVRFYARGNEFTSQLDHFVQSVVDRVPTRTPLAEGHAVDMVIHAIKQNAGSNLDCRVSSVASQLAQQPQVNESFISRILKKIRGL